MRFGNRVWASLSLRKGRPTSTRLAAAVSLDTNGSLRARIAPHTHDRVTPDHAVGFSWSTGPVRSLSPSNAKGHGRSAHRCHGLRPGRIGPRAGAVESGSLGGRHRP